MYEYHGWITIRESNNEAEINNNQESLGKIKEYLNDINELNTGILKLYPANGSYHITLGGQTNRKSAAINLIELYEFIGVLTVDSYGLLYEFDANEDYGFSDSFSVYVLSNGVLVKRKDVYLPHVFSEN